MKQPMPLGSIAPRSITVAVFALVCALAVAACPRDDLRDPIRLPPGYTFEPAPAEQAYLYDVKFLCDQEPFDQGLELGGTDHRPGNYATGITVHNFHDFLVNIRIKMTEPSSPISDDNYHLLSDYYVTPLAPNQARHIECDHIYNFLYEHAGRPGRLWGEGHFRQGIVEIVSPVEVSVIATYTANTCRFREPTLACSGEITLDVVPYSAFRVPALSPLPGPTARSTPTVTRRSFLPSGPTPTVTRRVLPSDDDPLHRGP